MKLQFNEWNDQNQRANCSKWYFQLHLINRIFIFVQCVAFSHTHLTSVHVHVYSLLAIIYAQFHKKVSIIAPKNIKIFNFGSSLVRANLNFHFAVHTVLIIAIKTNMLMFFMKLNIPHSNSFWEWISSLIVNLSHVLLFSPPSSLSPIKFICLNHRNLNLHIKTLGYWHISTNRSG